VIKLLRLLLAVICILMLAFSCQTKTETSETGTSTTIPELIYTKHARCRMECRHINEQEIKEVLAENHINMRKSNPNDPRGATYAYEGQTHENQHLRIIIDKAQTAWKVVTCIDLDHEFECDCH
jgi:Domain of unknown function (DUF4258)